MPEDIKVLKEKLLNQKLNFIDLGAFDGDTVINFYNGGIRFNKLVAFEPDIQSFNKMVKNLKGADIANEMILYPAGAGNENSIKAFDNRGDWSSKFSENGSASVTVVKIDDVLKGFNPNYIKMDIEGFEMDALRGLEKTIKQYKPFLAVCLYHSPDDLYDIPLYIKDLCSEYSLYIRLNGSHCFDTILYATI